MGMRDTEVTLRDWRFGHTQAERLCAQLLHLESFDAIDPQHPLGGPDGGKDLLCRKSGTLYIAAVYFPPTRPTFSEIARKFRSDLSKAKAHDAQGFVFFLNQSLTVDERDRLVGISDLIHTEIFHLERMRTLLDSPRGTGIHLEYLRIAMTEEEQLAFWSEFNFSISNRLGHAEQSLLEFEQRLESRLLSHSESLARIDQFLSDNTRRLNTERPASKRVGADTDRSAANPDVLRNDMPGTSSAIIAGTFEQLDDQQDFLLFVVNQIQRTLDQYYSIFDINYTIDIEQINRAYYEYQMSIAKFAILLHSANPDHYKRAGALMQALNAFKFLSTFTIAPKTSADSEFAASNFPLRFQEFVAFYHQQLLSFDIAYRSCVAYERNFPTLDFDYIHNVCLFLKRHPSIEVDACYLLILSLMAAR